VPSDLPDLLPSQIPFGRLNSDCAFCVRRAILTWLKRTTMVHSDFA
jgi:hypothetical protein